MRTEEERKRNEEISNQREENQSNENINPEDSNQPGFNITSESGEILATVISGTYFALLQNVEYK
jgi:hypothetical protein